MTVKQIIEDCCCDKFASLDDSVEESAEKGAMLITVGLGCLMADDDPEIRRLVVEILTYGTDGGFIDLELTMLGYYLQGMWQRIAVYKAEQERLTDDREA